ncbi:glutamine--fructose-6-phosphate transaminase (isomerizing) [Salisediminibacterium beveridgei]|uniref:Glutamine--fructose-6-phosphate aminotransferase [isomerizing] n=1 Tax=Salisediminibacterium beveridgei TaxID=632773 RepID=A0A1D7QZ46_9BACI|nr:glutamine--fructose-6-phosphate transaminase (isomerizing) [Salisediminibacterium beveridgei]AOM84289.1 Glucosamine--fructose-6-phosphate aminotransferase (isomerizing) [Salisediminibacterium beveridgei]
MCGIVGYAGTAVANDILLKGLERLEYRGYDSAGIALVNSDGVHVYKEKGRIATLREKMEKADSGMVGIGHTRWATHGAPSQVNAHPHQSHSGRFTLVHNGVIENYQYVQREYLADVAMVSDTDTEIIVQLIEKFANEDGMTTEEAFRKTLGLLKGSYATALLDELNPETIYVGKNKSPLLIGLSDDVNVIASDAMAMLQVTNEFLEIMDGEMVIVTRDDVQIKNQEGDLLSRDSYIAEIDSTDIEKGTYPHFMLKEIEEQPFVMRNIITKYKDENENIKLDENIRQAVLDADRIYIIAAGTSFNAGLVGKEMIEKIAHIPVETHIASEFLYNMPILSQNPLFIFISQSGETADSRGVLVNVKELGHTTLTITNVPGSTLSREAEYTLHTYAGPEIAVASTKAYTAQIAVLAILSVETARAKGIEIDFDPMQQLGIAANAMDIFMEKKDELEQMARDYLSVTPNCFYIGRGMDYHVCMEASLKLKEISYIQAEGFAGGELKHGTIALIEEGTPVVGLATQESVHLNLRGNMKEVVARGANPLMISMEGFDEADDKIVIPRVNELFTPLVSVIPMQFIAYYAALHRGCDVDKPRNLAKSVTVE